MPGRGPSWSTRGTTALRAATKTTHRRATRSRAQSSASTTRGLPTGRATVPARRAPRRARGVSWPRPCTVHHRVVSRSSRRRLSAMSNRAIAVTTGSRVATHALGRGSATCPACVPWVTSMKRVLPLSHLTACARRSLLVARTSTRSSRQRRHLIACVPRTTTATPPRSGSLHPPPRRRIDRAETSPPAASTTCNTSARHRRQHQIASAAS